MGELLDAPRSQALNERIRAARKGVGWTQEQVANRLGITVRSVSGWECGKAVPHLGRLMVLARALGQEPARFLDAAQAIAARRRAERVDQAALRIEGALREMIRRIRLGS